mgnify:CR=1 FL=1
MNCQKTCDVKNHAIYDAILWISRLFHYRDTDYLCNHDAPDDACHAKNDHAGRVLPVLP